MKKALFGTLRAALLFWRRLSSQLIEWGFEANPYDSCVVNKMINDKQCTTLWHVDHLKISHYNPEIVTSVIDMIEAEFGKEAPLTKTRGKVHEYLGTSIDFLTEGKVRFSMRDYVQGIRDDSSPHGWRMCHASCKPPLQSRYQMREVGPGNCRPIPPLRGQSVVSMQACTT